MRGAAATRYPYYLAGTWLRRTLLSVAPVLSPLEGETDTPVAGSEFPLTGWP